MAAGRLRGSDNSARAGRHQLRVRVIWPLHAAEAVPWLGYITTRAIDWMGFAIERRVRRSQSHSFPSTLRLNRVEGKRAGAGTTQRIAGRRAAAARDMTRTVRARFWSARSFASAA